MEDLQENGLIGFPEILDWLTLRGISFTRFDHPPLFTCEDAHKYNLFFPGIGTKNLFLRNKSKTRLILASVPEDFRLDISAFSKQIGVDRLSFGSPELLMSSLGVPPGSVTSLALVNDPHKKVKFWVHKRLLDAEAVQCHPLINTSTLVMPQESFRKFLTVTETNFSILND